VRPVPAALANESREPGAASAPNRAGGPRVSNNVDQDEEASQ